MAGAAYRSYERRTSTGKYGQIYDATGVLSNHLITYAYFALSLLCNWLLRIKAARS